MRLRIFLCPCLLLIIPSCHPQAPPPHHPPASPIVAPHPFSGDQAYLGLSKAAAFARAKRAGRRARIIQEDGAPFPITKDLRPRRLNFTITRGRVTRVTRG